MKGISMDDMEIQCQSPIFNMYKECEKSLKMYKFASFCHFSPKKDKITKLQNVVD